MTRGPGWMLCITIAPSISAMVGLPGMPRLKVGMNAVCAAALFAASDPATPSMARSEEHTSELQSLMRISYAVFCLKKKNTCNIVLHDYAAVLTTLQSILYTGNDNHYDYV